MPEWEKLFKAGKLNAARSAFFLPRAQEELYDVAADPHEVKNLAGDPAHRQTLERMRKALRDWQLEIKDTGLLAEAEMMRRAEGTTIYEMMRDPAKAPDLERLLEVSDLAGMRDAASIPRLTALLKDKASGVRYWGAVGLWALGDKAGPAADALRGVLKDESPAVRVIAAQSLLCHLGDDAAALPVLERALQDPNPMVQLLAANALDAADTRAKPLFDAMEQVKKGYAGRVMQTAVPEAREMMKQAPAATK
jgi:HEAT repeat protein